MNQRGVIYVETLIGFVPVFVFFFGCLQIADASAANLIVRHAATVAARAAVVVMPDDGMYYDDKDNEAVHSFTGQRRNDIEHAADLILRANRRLERAGFNVDVGVTNGGPRPTPPPPPAPASIGEFFQQLSNTSTKGDGSEQGMRELLVARVKARYRCLIALFCAGGYELVADASLVYQGARYVYEPWPDSFRGGGGQNQAPTPGNATTPIASNAPGASNNTNTQPGASGPTEGNTTLPAPTNPSSGAVANNSNPRPTSPGQSNSPSNSPSTPGATASNTNPSPTAPGQANSPSNSSSTPGANTGATASNTNPSPTAPGQADGPSNSSSTPGANTGATASNTNPSPTAPGPSNGPSNSPSTPGANTGATASNTNPSPTAPGPSNGPSNSASIPGANTGATASNTNPSPTAPGQAESPSNSPSTPGATASVTHPSPTAPGQADGPSNSPSTPGANTGATASNANSSQTSPGQSSSPGDPSSTPGTNTGALASNGNPSQASGQSNNQSNSPSTPGTNTGVTASNTNASQTSPGQNSGPSDPTSPGQSNSQGSSSSSPGANTGATAVNSGSSQTSPSQTSSPNTAQSPGTTPRNAAELRNVLPRNLRNVPIVRDPSLSGSSVRVQYTHNDAGQITGIEIHVGDGARARHIAGHVNTVRAMQRHQGLPGRVRALLQRLNTWLTGHPSAGPGTMAWEARREIEKLQGLIDARTRALQDPSLTAAERAELQRELDSYTNQLARYEAMVNSLTTRPGRGYVAAHDPDDDDPTPEFRARDYFPGLTPAQEAQLNDLFGDHRNPDGSPTNPESPSNPPADLANRINLARQRAAQAEQERSRTKTNQRKAFAGDGGGLQRNGWSHQELTTINYIFTTILDTNDGVMDSSRHPGATNDPRVDSGGLVSNRENAELPLALGASSASHAEQLVAISNALSGTNEPIGVAPEQCGMCRNWFREFAMRQQQTMVVADPRYTRVFYPNGQVEIYDAQGNLLETADGPTSISTRDYQGKPWDDPANQQ